MANHVTVMGGHRRLFFVGFPSLIIHPGKRIKTFTTIISSRETKFVTSGSTGRELDSYT